MKKIHHFLSSIKREVHKRKLVPFFCLTVYMAGRRASDNKRDRSTMNASINLVLLQMSCLSTHEIFFLFIKYFAHDFMFDIKLRNAVANGLFGKLLNLASEEVILEPVRTKCTPILLHGLECFQLGKADRHSLDFTFNRLCMKLFKTGSRLLM